MIDLVAPKMFMLIIISSSITIIIIISRWTFSLCRLTTLQKGGA